MVLITNLNELVNNLKTVDSYLSGVNINEKNKMSAYIKRGTCFVAYKTDNELRFAPSKFLGYINNTLERHKPGDTDGRDTNRAINNILNHQAVFSDYLENCYIYYCNKLGVKPNEAGGYGAKRKFWSFNIEVNIKLNTKSNFWHLAPGRNGFLWDTLKQGDTLGYEWCEQSLEDLTKLNPNHRHYKIIRLFTDVKKGDYFCVISGKKFYGIAEALEDYNYPSSLNNSKSLQNYFKNNKEMTPFQTIKVKWLKQFEEPQELESSHIPTFYCLNKKSLTSIFKILKKNGLLYNESRYSRLVWNENGWVIPSGPHGKSYDKDSHEFKFGYGHEEWLFDTSKIINGYHYAFLEPIHQKEKAYANNTYDIWLYTINGITKKRFWVGEIKNVSVIEKNEAENVKEIYIKNRWLDEMQQQIKACNANVKGFSNWQGLQLFNIKFLPKDISVNDPYYELDENHLIYNQSRYVFGLFNEEFQINEDIEDDNFTFLPSHKNDDENEPLETRVYLRQPKPVEITYLHKAISNSLTLDLQKINGIINVTKEHPTGYGRNRIDIVVNNKGNLIFYEIKTYNAISTSIREALGQLFEYCYHPDKQNAKELIIVTQIPADSPTRKYFNHLRNLFNIEIYYQSYDLDTKTLSEKC